MLVSKGVANSSVEEVSGVVRVEQLRTYIVIRPVDGQEGCCEFAMLYFDGRVLLFNTVAPSV